MPIEIELKYLVQGSDIKNTITSLLKSDNIVFKQSEKKLVNHYFETPDLNFRRHDMGLRVRETDGVFEQTIKTSGKVIGGLHQRPEYNVDIESNFPSLHLFPQNIWQDAQNISQLQQQVLSIFTTNFQRTIWLITANNGSEIELVFDQGSIETSGKSEDICEIELELVKGQPSDIFDVAELLFSQLSLRPGARSKAARGYGLWQNITPNFSLLGGEVLPAIEGLTLNTLFTHGVGDGLQNLQRGVEQYLSSKNVIALVDVTNILASLRHGFWLFEQQLGTNELNIREEISHFIKLLSWADSAVHMDELNNNTGNFRNKIFSEKALVTELITQYQQLPDFDEVSTLLHSSRFNRLQLNLLKFVLARENIAEAVENSDSALIDGQDEESKSLSIFAKSKLNQALNDLVTVLNPKLTESPNSLTIEQYINLRTELHRSLLTGTWLGSLFADASGNARVEYRSAWLDLQKGLSELQVLWVMSKKIDKLKQPSQKLVNWHVNKVEGLLLALTHSREHALNITPYWKLT